MQTLNTQNERGAAPGTGDWIPLMEYAIRMGLSLSTLRRHIKAKKVPFRIENGKYLLLCNHSPESSMAPAGATGDPIGELERELKRAREEIAELKTLIALYEETPSARLDT